MKKKEEGEDSEGGEKKDFKILILYYPRPPHHGFSPKDIKFADETTNNLKPTENK